MSFGLRNHMEKGLKKGRTEMLQVLAVCDKCLEEAVSDLSHLSFCAANLWFCKYW